MSVDGWRLGSQLRVERPAVAVRVLAFAWPGVTSYFGAHTDGTLSWVKNVAVPEAGAPMALRMFTGTYAVPEAGAPMSTCPCARPDTAEACPHS